MAHKKNPPADIYTRGLDQSNRWSLAFLIACDPVNVAVLKMSLFIASIQYDFYTKKEHPTSEN